MQGFKNENVQPGLCANKNETTKLLAKICIKEPFTIAPMKRHRSAAPQLGTLKV